ncbi:MAG TPA: hypothetical protein VFI34_13060 [Candidatus Limnocylindrales bacterium]|nr:hypothetical protein [Candidatus Limnocylindrales bacterium]
MTDDLAWVARGGDGAAPRLIAEIHGTVELERALAALGEPGHRASDAVEDELLGARVVDLEAVVLAEPSTEGRLAAGLARNDEGIQGRYLEAPVPLDELARRAAAAGVSLSRPGRGPFGREVLVLGGGIGGPFVVLVEPRSVPSPR